MTDESVPLFPDDPDWMADVDFHLFLVNRYDTSDVLIERTFVVVMDDTTEDGAYISSTVVYPPEPVTDADQNV